MNQLDIEIENRYADVMLRKASRNGECLECHYSTATHGYCKVAGGELAHRFIYRVKKGPIGNLWVLHKCDNRCCINIDHLFLGTQQDNDQDRVRKGRTANGSIRALSDDQCTQVRQLRASGISVNEIAIKFYVSARLIYQVLAREGRHANKE